MTLSGYLWVEPFKPILFLIITQTAQVYSFYNLVTATTPQEFTIRLLAASKNSTKSLIYCWQLHYLKNVSFFQVVEGVLVKYVFLNKLKACLYGFQISLHE